MSKSTIVGAQWPITLIRITGVVLVLFGFVYMFWPNQLAATSGTMLGSVAAQVEYRAYYGGLQLGLGAFLLVMSADKQHTNVLLGLILWCFGSVFAVRVFGVLTYKLTDDGFHMIAMGLELLVVVATIVALKAAKSVPPPMGS